MHPELERSKDYQRGVVRTLNTLINIAQALDGQLFTGKPIQIPEVVFEKPSGEQIVIEYFGNIDCFKITTVQADGTLEVTNLTQGKLDQAIEGNVKISGLIDGEQTTVELAR